MEQINRLAGAVNRLSLRERLFVFIAVAGVMYALCDVLLLSDLAGTQERYLRQIQDLRNEIRIVNQQAGALAGQREVDPDAAAREQLADLEAESRRLRAELQTLTSNLVPPQDMARLLEAVLTRDSDLRLLRLEGLGSVAVFEPRAKASRSSAHAGERETSAAPGHDAAVLTSDNLYRHGLRLDFSGGYLETLGYFRALEALPWRVLWESVAFDVQEYPKARVTITVFSLSLEGRWIGV